MATLKEMLRRAGQQLKASGAATPALDAGVLLGHVTRRSRAAIYRDWDDALTPAEEARFCALLARRAQGEPVAYLTGHKEFMGLDFVVNHTVLIPRPETELLVETALRLAGPAPLIVDAGTGSGAIAVSLAVYLPDAVVYATDCSREALAVARQNAASHGVAQRVSFFWGDLLAPLAGLNLRGRVDLLAANLPYIPTCVLSTLAPEVRRYEPAVALDGGADGLDLYRRLVPEAAVLLKPGGRLLLEIGPGQRGPLSALLSPPLWETEFFPDLAGLDRLAVSRLVSRVTGTVPSLDTPS